MTNALQQSELTQLSLISEVPALAMALTQHQLNVDDLINVLGNSPLSSIDILRALPQNQLTQILHEPRNNSEHRGAAADNLGYLIEAITTRPEEKQLHFDPATDPVTQLLRHLRQTMELNHLVTSLAELDQLMMHFNANATAEQKQAQLQPLMDYRHYLSEKEALSRYAKPRGISSLFGFFSQKSPITIMVVNQTLEDSTLSDVKGLIKALDTNLKNAGVSEGIYARGSDLKLTELSKLILTIAQSNHIPLMMLTAEDKTDLSQNNQPEI